MAVKKILIVLISVYLLFFCRLVHAKNIVIMSFNIENGGTHISFSSIVKAIKMSQAQIVAVQEAWGNVERLAKELQWPYYSKEHHIISRYPLYFMDGDKEKYIYVEVSPEHFIAITNLHLPYNGYGPSLVKAHKSTAEIINDELQIGFVYIKPYIKALNQLTTENIPVFLTGDFNAPSTLDWSANTIKKHHRIIPWPITQLLLTQGFIDSYRAINPDPNKNPGYTWPAMRPKKDNLVDGFNPSKDEAKARIDFIFCKGPVKTINSFTIGEPHSNSSIVITPWPSDHRALISSFKVIPKKIALTRLKRIHYLPPKKPILSVNQQVIESGKEFTIHWQNAPGNGYDYIQIAPINGKELFWGGDAVRLYTFAKNDGFITYSKENSLGNWPEWHSSKENIWPLQPGRYSIKFMLDDSLTPLNEIQITIRPVRKL